MSEARHEHPDEGWPEPEPERADPPRQPIFNIPGVVVAMIGLCAAIHLVRALLLDFEGDLWVILRFAFVPARYSGDYLLDAYAFISPVSYSLLHGNLAHLVVNLIWLAAFGSPLAARIGVARFLLFWVVTSLAAVGLHYVLHSTDMVPLVGASGAISGMMGAAARFGFKIGRSGGKPAFAGDILSVPAVFTSRATVTFLAVWMVVNLVMGLGFGMEDGPRIAWEAHIGGFLAGFFGIPLLVGRRG